MSSIKIIKLDDCRQLSGEFYFYFIDSAVDFNPPLIGRVDINDYYKKIIDNSCVILAITNKIIVGYCAFYMNSIIVDYGKAGYLTSIHVHKEFRRHHVATKLLDMMYKCLKAENIKVALLEVSVDNTAAFNFYSKIGFSDVGSYNKDSFGTSIKMVKRLA